MPMWKGCDTGDIIADMEKRNPKPETPWDIYWSAAISINQKFGGKQSSFEKMNDFLDNCQGNVSAGFSESYIKLFEPKRGFPVKWYKPLECETTHYFRSSKNPEEVKEHIGKLILKTNGIFQANIQEIYELEKDGYHRFDFYMKRNFPHRAFSGWIFDHPAPKWF